MNNLINFMQLANDPQQFLTNIINNSMAMNNPIMKNAIGMYQRGDSKGLQNLVNNVAKERGTSVDEIRKQMGI